MFKILDKTSQNHFCPFQGFEIFLQEIFYKKIQGKSSKSQMHIVITLESLISIKVILVHQNAPKPPLTRIKFEQLCTTNFLSLTPTFVSMFTWPIDDTTPGGASRRTDLHDWILVSPLLLISRVYKSCIGNFSQMNSILVEPLIFSCHLAPSSLMTRGVHLLSQINNKHLLPFFQSHHFDPFP